MTSLLGGMRAQEESKPEEKLLVFIKLAQASQQNMAEERHTPTHLHLKYTLVKEIAWKNMETGRQPTIHFIHAYCHLCLRSTSPGPHNFPVSYPISSHLALITQHFLLVQRQWISFYCLLQRQTEASSRRERCTCSPLVKGTVLMTARTAMTC